MFSKQKCLKREIFNKVRKFWILANEHFLATQKIILMGYWTSYNCWGTNINMRSNNWPQLIIHKGRVTWHVELISFEVLLWLACVRVCRLLHFELNKYWWLLSTSYYGFMYTFNAFIITSIIRTSCTFFKENPSVPRYFIMGNIPLLSLPILFSLIRGSSWTFFRDCIGISKKRIVFVI